MKPDSGKLPDTCLCTLLIENFNIITMYLILNMFLLFPATGPIAFSAALTSTITVSEGDVIKFDYEFVDTHDLHNPNIGTFTIPLTGIYEVNVNLCKASGANFNNAVADLYVDDTQLTRVYNRYADETDISHSSCSIIREFTIGNTIYVRAASSVSYLGQSVKYSQFNIKYLGSASEGVWRLL